MKLLRIALLSTLGLIALIIHDLLASLIEYLKEPTYHGMLGYGILLSYTGWVFIIILPISIGLGELWFKDVKKYIPHILLLIALSIWSANIWPIHPYRTSLFLACTFLTLPLRWLVDRTIVTKAVD
jgi:hypothetical protein